MKNYFMNRYGAIKDIDFSHIIKKLLFLNEQEAARNYDWNADK